MRNFTTLTSSSRSNSESEEKEMSLPESEAKYCVWLLSRSAMAAGTSGAKGFRMSIRPWEKGSKENGNVEESYQGQWTGPDCRVSLATSRFAHLPQKQDKTNMTNLNKQIARGRISRAAGKGRDPSIRYHYVGLGSLDLGNAENREQRMENVGLCFSLRRLLSVFTFTSSYIIQNRYPKVPPEAHRYRMPFPPCPKTSRLIMSL